MTLHLLEAVRAEAPEAAVVVGRLVRAVRAAGDAAGRRVGAAAAAEPVRGLEGERRPAGRLLRRRARAADRPRAGVQPLRARAGADLRDRVVRAPARRRAGGGRRSGADRHRQPRRAARLHRRARRGARLPARWRRARRPGIYNVCSGRPASAAELRDALGRVAGVGVAHAGRPEAAARARGDGGPRLATSGCTARPAGSPRSRSSRRSRTPSRGGARRSVRVARARACTSDERGLGIAPQTLSGRGSASNTRPRPFGQGTYVA